MNTDKQKQNNIAKIITLVVLLVVVLVLIYSNFIKKDNTVLYEPPKKVDDEKIYSKFHIDLFENEIFKNLVGLDKISTSTIDEKDIGRENPFLEF